MISEYFHVYVIRYQFPMFPVMSNNYSRAPNKKMQKTNLLVSSQNRHGSKPELATRTPLSVLPALDDDLCVLSMIQAPGSCCKISAAVLGLAVTLGPRDSPASSHPTNTTQQSPHAVADALTRLGTNMLTNSHLHRSTALTWSTLAFARMLC